MENNIYIGNRYVPILANPIEWDNLREYESLTIVTYNGTSYTSRKRVPAGTALSNTEYWAVTGNYNAQVEEYREEVDALNSAVTSEISNRQKADYMLAGGDLLCIGDSYLRGSNSGATLFKSWGDYLADYLGKTLNTDYFKYYQGGAGFVQSSDGKNFNTLLENAYSDISNPNNVGTIVVLGGVNDTNQNIRSGITTFVNNAKTRFPNATVYYGFVSTFIDTPISYILNCAEQYENLYFDNACVYIGNLAKHMSCYKMYDSDNQHPSQNGQKYIGRLVYSALNGCNVPNVNRPSKRIGDTDYYYNYVSNDMYHLGSYHKLDLNNLNVTDFVADGLHVGYTKVLRASDMYFNKSSDEYFHTTAPCLLHITTPQDVPQYYMGAVDIKLSGNTLTFYPYSVNNDYGNYGTGTLTRLIIAPFELNVQANLM